MYLNSPFIAISQMINPVKKTIMSDNSSATFYDLSSTKLDFQGTLIHQADPFQELELTIQLAPPQTTTPDLAMQNKEHQAIFEHPLKRTYLDHKELATLFGATSEVMEAVKGFYSKQNLKITSSNALARTITVKGNIASIDKAFQTSIGVYQCPNQFVFLAYQGLLKIPTELHGMIQNVTGITTLLKSEYRMPTSPEDETLLKAKSAPKGFTAQQLAKAYNYPENLTGKGQTIGIVELGGVYKKSDVQKYFKLMKLKVPKIIEVGTPIDDSNLLNNSEVTLDLQVAGTIAPAATLVIYYANTIAEAMALAIQDTKNKPTVISISWAGSEFNYNSAQIAQLNEVFYQAALLGITVLGASGDHGGKNSKQFPNVSIPSSSPLVIGCGGTTITLNDDDSIDTEVVWSQSNGTIGSGGGFSNLYPLPNYQHSAVVSYPYKTNSRGVPDMSANADAVNGYRVVFNGIEMAIGGTSASTPMIAGLFALFNESLGSQLGFVNPWLYQFIGEGFRHITEGNNGVYQAAAPWSPTAGMGSPNGQKLLELFKAGA